MHKRNQPPARNHADRRRLRLKPLLLALAPAWGLVAAHDALAQASAGMHANEIVAPAVEVVGITPTPGLGVPRAQVPYNVQSVSESDMRRAPASSLPEILADKLPSVSLNAVTGNGLQPDLAYRGFYASPLLGMPQGLSVYMDGVRMNDPFGDTVNWDLIPQNALAGATLLAGSNPVFGLNTLGGALSLQTKSGETHPGTEIEAGAGSRGRRQMSVEHGGSQDGLGWFVAANSMSEDGWRDYSPSRQNQIFAKVGRQTAQGDIDLSFAYSDSTLTGNGLTPESMLAARRESVYTHSDETRNTGHLLNLQASRDLDNGWWLAGNVYHRHTQLRGINPDVNEVADDRNGIAAYDDDPSGRQASINRQNLAQDVFGLNIQASLQGVGDRQITFGLAHESGRSDYRRSYQLGEFTSDRGIAALDPETGIVDVGGRTTSTGLFAVWKEPLARGVTMTASARYNQTHVRTGDRLFDPADPVIAGSQGLSNDFTYRRLNPSLGVTWEAAPALTAYASAGQSNRAPSPIELACADPNAPCTLPNAMQSDPYLKQVVTQTVEAGLRGRLGGSLRWNAGVYRADNQDDILFVATTTSTGYFQNFGRTRRQGVELGLSGDIGRFELSAGYSLVEATYRSDATVSSPDNSTADANGNIQIKPGNTIPGIPRQQFKVGVAWKPADGTRIGAQLVAFSSQYVRGNENNAHQADGVDFFGSGTLPGYAVVNLNAETSLGGGWQAFGRIANLFDRNYATAGQLAQNAFPNGSFEADPAQWCAETFAAPGAPRSIFIGLRYRM
ncbi:MAG: TonB-dependent receptor [Zoogloea sp.]|nr:TonB-dependent receptor [Zoogloea sp.]